MKCQTPLFWGRQEKCFKMLSAKILTQHAIKALTLVLLKNVLDL